MALPLSLIQEHELLATPWNGKAPRPQPTAAKPSRTCSPSLSGPNLSLPSGPGINHVLQILSTICVILFIKLLHSTHYRPGTYKGNSFTPQNQPYKADPLLSSFHRKGNWGRVRLGRARIQIQAVNYYSLGCITSQRISRRTLVLQGSQYPLLQKDFLISSFSPPFPWYHVPGWSCLLISSQQIRVQHLCCLAHSSTTLSAPCSQTACLSISENPMPVPSGSSRNLCWRMRSSMNEQMDTMLGRQ